MALFPTPIINDGTADRTFAFKGQDVVAKTKTMSGSYIETSAPLVQESNLVVKYNEAKTTVRRRLLQHGIKRPIADGTTYKPIIVNITVTHHPEHSEGDIAKSVLVAANAAKLSGFITRWLQGLIG